jgi:hypothetical protein
VLEQIAFADICLVAVSVVFAAMAGMRGNVIFSKWNMPNHVARIFLASSLFLVASANAVLRRRNPDIFRQKAKAIYITGYFDCFALVTVLGFFGDVLIYGF